MSIELDALSSLSDKLAAAQQVPVLHEPRAVGDAIVEAHGFSVGFVSQPVHPIQALIAGERVHVLDQLTPDPRPPELGHDVEILKITVVVGGPAGAVTDVMDEA